jgi:hypothetical protein
MTNIPTIKINEEPNIMDDHLLDLLGGQFNFDHEKGLAEWIKNSVDAYIRKGVSDNQQNVIIRFRDNKGGEALIECVDFVGMSAQDIGGAFKRWGDPEASKRGLKTKTYGGHGNGGKFYMRQMFKESYFITYWDGYLNIYGFSTNKKYGFAEGKKNIPMTPEEALKEANLWGNIPESLKNKVLNKETGFTLVRGITPFEMPKKIKSNVICKKIINHPQARRVLTKVPVQVFHNEKEIYNRLIPDEIKPKKGFEEPIIIPIPDEIPYEKHGEDRMAVMTSAEFPSGYLVLKTSELALGGQGRFSELSRIDILGGVGVIASYRITDLPRQHYLNSEWIYGECECSILEDQNNCAVTNDREKLNNTDTARALTKWIAEQIDDLALKIQEQQKQEQQEVTAKLSSKYNDFLNQWKNKFLNKLMTKVAVGRSNSSGGLNETDSKGGGKSGDGGGDEKNSKEEKSKKGSKFPEVKLSSYDEDPLNPGNAFHADPRHPIIYQRPQDVSIGIYWINTSSPLAKKIIDKYGPESLRWRDFLFQRYVDIFVRESLDLAQKKDPDSLLLADGINRKIDEIVTEIHAAAAKDLTDFLFNDYYDPESTNII